MMGSWYHCSRIGDDAFAVAEWSNNTSTLASSVLSCAVGEFGGNPLEGRSIPVLTLSRISLGLIMFVHVACLNVKDTPNIGS